VNDASGVGAPTWSWVVVYQAIGMTMEYLDCSGLAAFEALMTRAAATGQTVSDLSADVVERRFRFPAGLG
jgi:isopentenyl diphosphate isomerase/L-lactate dehydrogenase-like FMN-dependent dehydrogenase